jgi:hypothetical protein
MTRSGLLSLSAKSLLLAAAAASLGAARTWMPFANCTETGQVDSIHAKVWIDESLIPENAPYLGSLKFQYHPGTCFVKQTVQKPSYMDTTFTFNYTLSADKRMQQMEWALPGPKDSLPRQTSWFNPAGDLDSTIFASYRAMDGTTKILVSDKTEHLRGVGYALVRSSLRKGNGPWTVYALDSVVTIGGVTTVHTEDEDGTYVTRCEYPIPGQDQGATYTCTPTAIGEVDTELQKEVWHLTGNRIDSVRTFKPDGRLESTDSYHWSSRIPGAVRRAPRAGKSLLLGLGTRDFDLLGRRFLP